MKQNSVVFLSGLCKPFCYYLEYYWKKENYMREVIEWWQKRWWKD